MTLQEKILKEYLRAYENPTMAAISIDTGIQNTRVFRILKGSTMKLNEYEIFKQRIDRKTIQRPSTTRLQKMISEIQEKLSQKDISEIEGLLARILRIFSLMQRGGNR